MKCRKALALTLAASMILSTMAVTQVAARTAEMDTGSFVQEFWDVTGEHARPTVRYWISVAADAETVYDEICSFAKAGYGGVEIVAFASKAKYEDGSTVGEGDEYAWGTPHWNGLLKAAMEAAVASDIKLDYTFSFAWPISAPEIQSTADPAAEVSLVVGKQALTSGATYTGAVPAGSKKENSKLLGVSLVRITDGTKEEETTGGDGGWWGGGSSSKETYEFDTIVDLTAQAYEDENSASGYSISCEVPAEGDWALFASWESPTESRKNGYLVIDHYGEAGAQAIINHWVKEVIPAVGEDLFRAASRSIFCDSLEQSGNWSHQMIETFREEKGYDITPYLFLLTGNYFADAYNSTYKLSDTEVKDKILRDYYDVLTTCFTQYHLAPIEEFCREYGMTLRYQTAYGKTLELSETAMHVDIPETEAMMIRFPVDNIRAQAGAVHTAGKNLYTAELQAEAGKTYSQTWDDFLYVLQRQWAGGVNNFTMHGISYSGAFTGNDADPSTPWLDGVEWPGYEGFGRTSYSNNWNRMPTWEHISDYMDYTSRMNYVLQQGVADVDIAVYRNDYLDNIMPTGMTPAKDGNYIYRDGGLLERVGYTYDFVGPANLKLETSVVHDGVLCADGPSYKAMIIQNQSYMPTDTAKRILDYARDGLPIVIVGETPDVSSNLTEDNTELLAVMHELTALENVVMVDGYDEVPSALQTLAVTPDTAFSQGEDVLTVHRSSEEADFYYIYNFGRAGQAGSVVKESDYATIAPVSFKIAFRGEGVPYLLNPWSGEITPIAEYRVDGDTVTLPIALDANESKVVAFAPAGWVGETVGVHVTDADAAQAVYSDDGKLMLKSFQADTCRVALSDGKTVRAVIHQVADPVELRTWNLSVKDYCPGTTPIETVFNTIDVGETTLKSWTEIEGIEHAAGIGTYTTTFTLPENWGAKDGAILNLGRVQDSFRVSINGNALPNGNRYTSEMDISSYLHAGENTITVEVATTLVNKIISVYENDRRTPEEYGLLGVNGVVTITPYALTELIPGSVTMKLIGAAEATVDQEELTYTVSVTGAEALATATAKLAVDGLMDPIVEAAEGWYVMTQSVEDGILTAVLGNNAGLTSEKAAAIATLTAKTAGKVGTVSVKLLGADLSVFVGEDGEAFVEVVLDNASVETTIRYSVYDVNQDGLVNQLDITRAQRFYGTDHELADVNQDGEVNITDLILILNNYTK